jgi:hypothetical protein
LLCLRTIYAADAFRACICPAVAVAINSTAWKRAIKFWFWTTMRTG